MLFVTRSKVSHVIDSMIIYNTEYGFIYVFPYMIWTVPYCKYVVVNLYQLEEEFFLQ
jgi:hypothetical protein